MFITHDIIRFDFHISPRFSIHVRHVASWLALALLITVGVLWICAIHSSVITALNQRQKSWMCLSYSFSGWILTSEPHLPLIFLKAAAAGCFSGRSVREEVWMRGVSLSIILYSSLYWKWHFTNKGLVNTIKTISYTDMVIIYQLVKTEWKQTK